MPTECYIDTESHRNFKRDPASPMGSRFFLAIRSKKVRLAACRLLRDDRLIVYLLICVRHRGRPRFSLRLGHARVLTVHRTVIHCARAAPLRHPLQKIIKSLVGVDLPGDPKNKRISPNNHSVCHSERSAERVVELSRSEITERKREAFCRSGIWLKISVACQRNVTSIQKDTQTPSHIPASLPLLGFVSDRRLRLTPSTKLRLRKPLRDFLRSE